MRINAFTLLELLIAMAVSAILLNMAYLALRIVEQQQRVSLQTLHETRQAATLQWLLARDFHRSSHVMLQQGELVCWQPGNQVIYSVQDSFLIRHQTLVVDTFALPLLQMHFWLKKHSVASGLVDEVSFSLRFHQDTLHVGARTQYGAAEILSYAPSSLTTP